jgi:hypothetical protein
MACLFSFLFISRDTWGDSQETKILPSYYMGYQPHSGGCFQYPSVATWVALTWAYPGHSPTQNEPFKEVKKSFLPSYLYMENSIKELVKICLFLKNRPSIYNIFFGIGNTSCLLFSW